MAMDPKLLEAFRDVMETQSMTGAAKLAGVTQPAVSAQIARLETLVGFELFDRMGGRLKASEKGRLFYEEVRPALDSLDRLDKTARGIKSGSSAPITVASHPSASISLLPDVVAKLLAKRPDAEIRMINRTSERVRAVFEAGGADVAIAEGPINMIPGMELRRFRVECCAILPQGHALSPHEIVTPEVLRDAPFIAMAETRGIGHLTARAFSGAGVPYAPLVVSENFSSICRLVALGAGVAIVDRRSAETFASGGLAIRRFEPRIDYEVCVFYRAAPPPTELAQELLTLINADFATWANRPVDAGPQSAAPR